MGFVVVLCCGGGLLLLVFVVFVWLVGWFCLLVWGFFRRQMMPKCEKENTASKRTNQAYWIMPLFNEHLVFLKEINGLCIVFAVHT